MLKFLEKLVELDTNSDMKSNYRKCARVIAGEARGNGFRVSVMYAKAPDKKKRPNVIVNYIVGAKKTLLLNAHYDVVPAGEGWKYPPFKLTVKGGKAFGRGTCDDKGAIFACLEAMKELKRKGSSKVNVVFAATCDEEVGGEFGLGAVMKAGLRGNKVSPHEKGQYSRARTLLADAALVVDGGPELDVGCSGIVFGKIVVKGEQGHAALPNRCRNAIYEGIRLVEELGKYAKIREGERSRYSAPKCSPHKKVYGRFSVTMFHSGEKENMIPGECEIRFDARALPEEKVGDLKKDFRKFFEKAVKKTKVKAKLAFTEKSNGFFTSEKEEFVKRAKKAFGVKKLTASLGGTDGRHVAKYGIPTILTGVMRIDTRAHGKDEFVHLKDIERVKRGIVNLCENGW